ncbi:MAG: AAA family ATPase [Actinobacteria bacterium]|nr:AAA family ATPase [Actinomycetota bacterium]
MTIWTARGTVAFGNVKQHQVAPFFAAVDRSMSFFAPGGPQSKIDEVLSGFDPFVDLITRPDCKILQALPQSVTPLQLVGNDSRFACIRALGPASPSFEQSLLLNIFAANSPDFTGDWGPGRRVRQDLRDIRAGARGGMLLTRVDRGSVSDDLKTWREAIGIVMSVAEAFVRIGHPNNWSAQLKRLQEAAADSVRITSTATSQDLDAVLGELDGLLGLTEVKAAVHGLANLIRVQALREQQGLADGEAHSRHLVFTGNPGTGKTTIARLLGRMYQVLGVLPSGHMVEAARQDLVGGYVGQTAIKTQEIFDKARGGILFIDEAYSLARSNSEMDYGQEAIDTLVKLMEDHRDDTAVIVAGYPEEMEHFLTSNPGLRSRFSRVINFPDYSATELLEIALADAHRRKYDLTKDAKEAVQATLDSRPREHGFGNGRLARQLLEDAIMNQASRVSAIQEPTTDDLRLITAADIPS